jgi:7-carboxy-7-deazaguanine synthase
MSRRPEEVAAAVRSRPAEPRIALPATDRLRVCEIFHSIQGESTHAGRRCVMVRLTGCQMRCRWCDSEYSFHEGSWMTRAEVVAAVASHHCELVEITGGEPMLQPGVGPLMSELCDAGHEVLLETGGGLPIDGVDPRVRRILDVKCPGSGEAARNRWENLDLLRAGDEVKFVLADRADYRWARDLVCERDLAARVPVHFSPVHGELPASDLAAWILDDRLAVRLHLQLHKWVWDPNVRGI